MGDSVTFLDRAKAKASPGGQQCKFRKALEAMGPKLAAEATDAVHSDVSAPVLSDVFQEDGFDVSADSIRRHRKGQCVSCRDEFPR